MRYFIVGPHRGQPDRFNNGLARVLGIVSLLLGAGELVFARQLADALGLDGMAWIITAYGVREILTGIVVLAFKDAAPGIWLRVAGDLLDGATLAFGYFRDPSDHRNILLAALAVTPVVLLDIYCALRFKSSSPEPLAPIGTPV